MNFLPEAAASRKSLRRLIVCNLGAEALAAFGTAGVNHPATADGSHTRTKTVAALANEFAGLKCPFHKDKIAKKGLLREGICNGLGRGCQREYEGFP